PSSAAVTVTSAGSGCADSNSRSARRCSLTSASSGKAECPRIASRFSSCSMLTDDLPSVGLVQRRSRLARPSKFSEANGLSGQDDVGAAGEVLVDLEPLRHVAVLPIGGERQRMLEGVVWFDGP